MNAALLKYALRFGPWMLVGGLAWGWFASHDARVAERALLKHTTDSMGAVAAETGVARDVERRARAASDSVYADSLKRLQSRLLDQRRQNVTLVRMTDSAVAAARTVQDSAALVPRLIVTVRGLEAELADQRAATAQVMALWHSDSLTIRGLDSTATELRALNASTLRALQIAQRKASPGMFAIAWRAAPIIAAVGAVAYTVGSSR